MTLVTGPAEGDAPPVARPGTGEDRADGVATAVPVVERTHEVVGPGGPLTVEYMVLPGFESLAGPPPRPAGMRRRTTRRSPGPRKPRKAKPAVPNLSFPGLAPPPVPPAAARPASARR